MKQVGKIESFIVKIPYLIIMLLMIVIAPVGVWFFVVKTSVNKRKIYSKSKLLKGMAVFTLLIIIIGLYSKVKEIIELCGSGMSLDMISFIPDNFFLYIVGTIMVISYFIGGKKLMEQAKTLRRYIKCINLDKEISIKKLSKKLSISIEEVKENLNILNKCGYLIPFDIDDKKNKIIYKEQKEIEDVTSSRKKQVKNNKTVQCPNCGAFVILKLEEYIECDFCGYGLIEENNR